MKNLKFMFLLCTAIFITACTNSDEVLRETDLNYEENLNSVSTNEGDVDGTELTEGNRERIFNMGPEHHILPQSNEEYVEMLANKVSIYNEIALELWYNNPVTDLSLLVTDADFLNFWYINQFGEISNITKEEAEEHGFDENVMFQEFYPFSEGHGFYLVIDYSSIDLERSLIKTGIGPLDIFGTVTHYIVHIFFQSTYPIHLMMVENPNPERSERLSDLDARVLRIQIINQLLDAIANDYNEQYILNALSTFVYYRDNFYEDYAATRFWDGQEGIASWFEYAAGMMASYEGIETKQDLHEAVTYLARYHRKNTHFGGYNSYGAVSGSYIIGMLTLFVIDTIQDRAIWQSRFAEDNSVLTHPLNMLLEIFEDYELPQFISPSQSEINAIDESIRRNNAFNAVPPSEFVVILNRIFGEHTFDLYDILNWNEYVRQLEVLQPEIEPTEEHFEEFRQDFFFRSSVYRENIEYLLSEHLEREISLDFVQGPSEDNIEITKSLGLWLGYWLVWEDVYLIMEYFEDYIN